MAKPNKNRNNLKLVKFLNKAWSVKNAHLNASLYFSLRALDLQSSFCLSPIMYGVFWELDKNIKNKLKQYISNISYGSSGGQSQANPGPY